MEKHKIKFLIQCGIIKCSHSSHSFQEGVTISSELFIPAKHRVCNCPISSIYSLDESTNLVLEELEKGMISFVEDADDIYNRALTEHNAKEFEMPDGATGIITDVTKEEWYKNPRIELYDMVEEDAFALACKCAEFIGVTMNEDVTDYYIAKHITEATMNILTEVFGVQFPCGN